MGEGRDEGLPLIVTTSEPPRLLRTRQTLIRRSAPPSPIREKVGTGSSALMSELLAGSRDRLAVALRRSLDDAKPVSRRTLLV